MPGEVRFAVVAACGAGPRIERDAVDAPAVELFTARARAARPGFELTDEDAWLAAEISRLVDGLPLAIELAAARVNVLGLAEILALVSAAWSSSTSGRAAGLRCRPCRARDARRVELRPPARGREDAAPPCRGAPRRCASPRTRRGGRRPRARRDDGGRAARRRSSTSRSSRCRSRAPTRATTCSTPSATTRSSALPKAAGSRRRRKAHAEYFATLADTAHAALRGPDWRACVGRLELEHDNLWAALAYAQEAPDAGHRGPVGHARLVLHGGGARLRRPPLRRARTRHRVRRCAGRAPTRVGGVSVLLRDGGVRSRRGYRDRRTRARRDRAATAAVGSRRGDARARPRRIR